MTAHLSSFNPNSRTPHSPIKILSSTAPRTPHIGTPKPPWQVPAPVHLPSRTTTTVFEQQLNRGLPISLRLLQLRKKREKLVLNNPLDSTDLGPAGNAVWSLACLLENLHKSALPADRKELPLEVSRENRYSLVWLFQTVFSNSPDLALGVILMTANFMVRSVDELLLSIGSTILEQEDNDRGSMILEPEKQSPSNGAERAYEDYKKTIAAYERMIVTEKSNSMILSNYAQLLYEYEKDFERAGDCFLRAVRADPDDAEAMSRYGMFLWHARGDVDGAEEMFEAAMQAEDDSSNSYHRCNYIRFLLKTGRTDICYSADECSIDDDDEDVVSGL